MSNTCNIMQDLEEQLLQIHSFEEDISLILGSVDLMSEDELMNCLIGLREMMRLRNNQTFDVYMKALDEYYLLRGYKLLVDDKICKNWENWL